MKVYCLKCKHREHTMEHGDSCLKFTLKSSSYLTLIERYAPCEVVNQANDCRWYEEVEVSSHVKETVARFKKLFKGVE